MNGVQSEETTASLLKRPILDLLRVEDLPPDIRLIHDACGMEVVKLLLTHLGGGRFYVPKPVSLEPLFERFIRAVVDEAGVGDVRIIAARLGVSVEKVRCVAQRVLAATTPSEKK